MNEIKRNADAAIGSSGGYVSPAGLSVSQRTVPPAVRVLAAPAEAVSGAGMARPTFQDLFCEKFQCAPELYEQAVLWRCIYPSRLPVARFIWRFNRDYFAADFNLIEAVAHATDADSVESELNHARYRFRPRGLLRGKFRVRVSSQRLLHLAKQVFKLVS